jgi:hypothetical protein
MPRMLPALACTLAIAMLTAGAARAADPAGVYAVTGLDGPCRIVLADTATLPEGLSAEGREVSGLAMAEPGCPGPLAEAALWTLDADRARLVLIGMGGEPVAELGAMPGGVWSGRIEALGVIRMEKVQDRD